MVYRHCCNTGKIRGLAQGLYFPAVYILIQPAKKLAASIIRRKALCCTTLACWSSTTICRYQLYQGGIIYKLCCKTGKIKGVSIVFYFFAIYKLIVLTRLATVSVIRLISIYYKEISRLQFTTIWQYLSLQFQSLKLESSQNSSTWTDE